MNESLKYLIHKGVYISFVWEHYVSGSNLNFQIEFRKSNVPVWTSMWYGDNGEWGDGERVMRCAIEAGHTVLDATSGIFHPDDISKQVHKLLQSRRIDK